MTSFSDPNCMRCPLHEGASHVCMPGTGPIPSSIMLVGEAPGHTEDRDGGPFLGRAGSVLDEMLEDCGVDRSELYVTNSVRCRPPENRKPRKSEIKQCRFWFDLEFKKVKPKFVLLMGAMALESVLDMKGLKQLRGKPIQRDGVTYFPTYHPASIFYNDKLYATLSNDLAMFFRLVEREGQVFDKGVSFEIADSWPKARRMVAEIAKLRKAAYDCETSSLDPYGPGEHVVSLGIGDHRKQYCFPLQHPEGWLYDKPKAQQRLIRLIDRVIPRKRIAHNGKFDAKWMKQHFDVWWHPWFDTMLAMYNCDENTPNSLDYLAQSEFNAVDYNIPLSEKHGHGPLERHCRYLAGDIYYTFRGYRLLYKRLKLDRPTWNVFWHISMPASTLYAEGEHKGLWLNPKKIREARKHWRKKRDAALNELNRRFPDDRTRKDKKTKEIIVGINWNSPDQVAEILFDKLELPVLEETATGKPATSEHVLLQLSERSDVPKLILDYRGAEKNLNTFIGPWIAKAINNRLHPNVKIHGTVTGRPSCENPNTQQTPRDKTIRSNIEAPPGRTFIDADLSQIELRITAEMSGEEEMLRCFLNDIDIHTRTVESVFGITEPSPEERKKAKAINFGFIYGMWWRKFIRYAYDKYGLVFTANEAKNIRNAFFRLYQLEDWHKRQRRFARLNGYVRSLLGRKRRLPILLGQTDTPQAKEAERQSINAPVQGFASDLNLLAALHLKRILDPGRIDILLTMHDAIMFECDNDYVDTACPIIYRTMICPPQLKDIFDVELGVPLDAELKLGSWGSGEVYHV